MIITLTGNLLAERTFVADDWKPGKTQRASAESFQVGGKGINVTKMLARIGESTTAWCFVGGAPGDECSAWLQARGLPHRAFSTQAATRTGLVIRDSRGVVAETTFLGPDRAVDAAALRACAEALARERISKPQPQSHSEAEPHSQPNSELQLQSEREAWPESPLQLALCGSFPGFASEEAAPLRDELAQWARDDQLSVDTYGPPLRWSLDQPVSLVKINRDEFVALFESSEREIPVNKLLTAAGKRWPVRAWVITDGPNDVFFALRSGEVGCVSPPQVKEVSATGSGDVVFACLLHALHTLKKPLAEAVKFALPYGAANAGDSRVAEFALNNLPGVRSFPK